MNHILTDAQREARERFDLENAMAALPPEPRRTLKVKGAAGYRLRADLFARISDELLRDFATNVLGAIRISSRYLDALRIVLGNQAHAERNGYVLEMNIRTLVSSERVMRNIIDQMKAAGITTAKSVALGPGQQQVVQVFERSPGAASEGIEWSLEAMLRAEERAMDARLRHKVWEPQLSDVLAEGAPY